MTYPVGFRVGFFFLFFSKWKSIAFGRAQQKTSPPAERLDFSVKGKRNSKTNKRAYVVYYYIEALIEISETNAKQNGGGPGLHWREVIKPFCNTAATAYAYINDNKNPCVRREISSGVVKRMMTWKEEKKRPPNVIQYLMYNVARARIMYNNNIRRRTAAGAVAEVDTQQTSSIFLHYIYICRI